MNINDEVRTHAYACLCGKSISDIFKSSGIKFGEKGIINLGKMVPAVGGIIGAGLDISTTKIIAKNAMKNFFDVRVVA